MTENEAEQILLSACRRNQFRTRAKWGMRCDVALGGFGTTERTPCVILDLERTDPHPTRYGFSVPRVLMHGQTWVEVLSKLQEKGEIP